MTSHFRKVSRVGHYSGHGNDISNETACNEKKMSKELVELYLIKISSSSELLSNNSLLGGKL